MLRITEVSPSDGNVPLLLEGRVTAHRTEYTELTKVAKKTSHVP